MAPLARRVGRRPHVHSLRRAGLRAFGSRSRGALARTAGWRTSRPWSMQPEPTGSCCWACPRAPPRPSPTPFAIPSESNGSCYTAATRADGCAATKPSASDMKLWSPLSGQAGPTPIRRFAASSRMLFLPRGEPGADGLVRRAAAADGDAGDRRAALSTPAPASTSASWLPSVTADTLVAHARDDRVVPFEEGRILASLLPRARLLPLDSRNHILLPDEPAWHHFRAEFHAFLAEPSAPAAGRVARVQQPRAGSSRAGGRRAEQRGDRLAAVHQRPDRRAPPLEHLRQARRLREGGTGSGRCSVRAALRVSRHAARCDGHRSWVLAPMRAAGCGPSVPTKSPSKETHRVRVTS